MHMDCLLPEFCTTSLEYILSLPSSTASPHCQLRHPVSSGWPLPWPPVWLHTAWPVAPTHSLTPTSPTSTPSRGRHLEPSLLYLESRLLHFPQKQFVGWQRQILTLSQKSFYLEPLFSGGSPGGTSGKEPACPCRRQETWIQSLGQEDPLQESVATHSSILTWIPMDRGAWRAESRRVGHDWSDLAHMNPFSGQVFVLLCTKGQSMYFSQSKKIICRQRWLLAPSWKSAQRRTTEALEFGGHFPP